MQAFKRGFELVKQELNGLGNLIFLLASKS